MSSNHDDSLDQAEGLRKQMKQTLSPIEQEQQDEVEAVTELPPRSEVHRKKENTKTKFRIRYPIVRLLAITFVLIVVLVASYNLWKDHVQLSQSTATSQNGPANESNIDIYEMKDKEPQIKNEFNTPKPTEEEQNKNSEQVEEEEAPVESPEVGGQSENEETKEVEQPTPAQPKTTEEAEEEAVQQPTQKIVYHRVKANETLYRVSMKYFHSRAGEDIIKKANGLDANGTIMTGQLLKIPLSN